MNPHDLVTGIRRHVIEENMEIYHDLFENTKFGDVSDPYWTKAMELYSQLSCEQKAVFFSVIRQVMLDTCSNLLGVLDGVSWLEGQSEGLRLTTESGSEKLNEGLQDILLSMEEKQTR